jgi:outer membrane protein OmpU
MTNVKKIGLTALAGTLAATSAYAGALDVTGTAKVTFTSLDETEHTQNNYSMSQGITFAGSGELDNGMTISYSYTMSNAAFSASSLKLDMGDMGSLHFAEGTSPAGIGAYRDKMPTAGEEVWDDLDGEANGAGSFASNGTIGYNGSFGMMGVSASYNKNASTSTTTTDGSAFSVVLHAAPTDGSMVFYGIGEGAGADKNSTTDKYVIGGTYVMGAGTVGIQQTGVDVTAVNGDMDRLHASASFAVNENLSLSYGMSTVSFENPSLVDQEDSGVAVSYTMGSMTLGGSWNSSDNVSGASGTDDTHTEIGLAFAF